MQKRLSRSLFLSALLLAIGLFYLLCLPKFVQGGDTGELVAASHRLFVAHPPGYPLWIWLQHFFQQLFPFGTIFWRASLLTALFAVATLFVIALPLSKKTIYLCLPLLALSKTFIESAVLPDVFSLHALFIALIGSLYFFGEQYPRLRRYGIPFLFCLGLAHHLTIVLLTPLLVDLFWEDSTPKKRLTIVSLCFLGVPLLLYASLLLLHPESSFSWGALHDAKTVWQHFLRTDYGTFQLTSGSKAAPLAGLFYFFSASWVTLSAFAFFLFFSYRQAPKNFRNRKILTLLFCISLSLGFIAIANIPPFGIGKEVLLRFHLLPLVEVTLLTAVILERSPLISWKNQVGFFVAFASFLALAFSAHDTLSLHEDSVFADYADNLLREADQHHPSLIFTTSDNAYFALKYLQATQDQYLKVTIASPALFFNPWYLGKIKQSSSEFSLPEAEKIWQKRELDVDQSLIQPNLKKFSIFVTNGYQDGKNYHVVFLGLGRILQSGTGLEFLEQSTKEIHLHSVPDASSSGPQAFSKALLFSEYSHFFLAKGLNDFQENQLEFAKEDWSHALDIVPYAMPALKNLCAITNDREPRCAEKNKNTIFELGSPYF